MRDSKPGGAAESGRLAWMVEVRLPNLHSIQKVVKAQSSGGYAVRRTYQPVERRADPVQDEPNSVDTELKMVFPPILLEWVLEPRLQQNDNTISLANHPLLWYEIYLDDTQKGAMRETKRWLTRRQVRWWHISDCHGTGHG